MYQPKERQAREEGDRPKAHNVYQPKGSCQGQGALQRQRQNQEEETYSRTPSPSTSQQSSFAAATQHLYTENEAKTKYYKISDKVPLRNKGLARLKEPEGNGELKDVWNPGHHVLLSHQQEVRRREREQTRTPAARKGPEKKRKTEWNS